MGAPVDEKSFREERHLRRAVCRPRAGKRDTQERKMASWSGEGDYLPPKRVVERGEEVAQ